MTSGPIHTTVVRPGDPPPSCQHYRIDNATGQCEACGEQMITQHMDAKTVLSAPNAAPCRNTQHLAAIEAGEDFECHHPYVPDYSRAKTVVLGWDYSYECEWCHHNGTTFTYGEPVVWDCGHSHRGAFIPASTD